VPNLLHGLNLSAPADEPAYRAARFAEYAGLSCKVAGAGALLILVLWLRVYAHDPVNAIDTLPLRLVMVAAVATYCAAFLLRVPRALLLAIGYVAVAVVEFSILAMWSGLAAGYLAAFPGYLFIYLITPLILMPFTFRESVGALLLVPIVPNLQVAAGLAPGFPLFGFNAMIWPAAAMALFVQRQFDVMSREVFRTRRRLGDLANRDELTGLGNRRHLLERGEDALRLAQRHGRPLAVLLLDVDHFKSINDRFGHAAGDDVLRMLSASIALQMRATDVVGRSGGEEFTIVLPETGVADALAIAERLRATVAATPIATDEAPQAIPVTVSIGVAALDAECERLNTLVSRADKALYAAKHDGRNRVRTYAREHRRAVGGSAQAF
jgi:diguanylate cyclase (GGDEF)-like protein